MFSFSSQRQYQYQFGTEDLRERTSNQSPLCLLILTCSIWTQRSLTTFCSGVSSCSPVLILAGQILRRWGHGWIGHLVGALFRRKKFRYKTIKTFNLIILLNRGISKWWTGKHKNFVIFIAVLFLGACVSPLYMCVKLGVHVWTVQGPVQCTHKN